MADYRAPVAGESFRNADGSSRQEEIARCLVGEPVTLEREPDNQYDPNCVKVISARGIQIGNLAREAAGWIAERLDADRQVSAEIESIGSGDSGLLGVVLAVTTRAEERPMSGTVVIPTKAAPAEATKGETAKGCAVLIVIILILGALLSTCGGQTEEEKASSQAQEAEKRKSGFHCLSAWDGSSDSLIRQVKEQLRDPNSFEHVETKIAPVNEKGFHAVFMTYRARNGFGGMNVGKAGGAIEQQTCEATGVITSG